MIGFLLAFLVAILWSIGEVSYSKMSKKHHHKNVYLYSFLFRALLYLGVVFFFQRELFGTFHWIVFSQALPVILCDLFASIVVNIAVYNGKLSVTSPIMAAYPVLDVLLGILLLKESIHTGKLILIGLICLSIIVLAASQTKSDRAPHPIKGILFAVVYMLLVALSTYFEKNIYISHFDVYDLYYYKGMIYCVVSFVFFCSILFTPVKLKKPDWSIIKGCSFTPIGNILYSFALSVGSISIIAPISSLYSVFTNIISRIHLKEKISWVEKICIYCILICTILLISLFV